MIGGFMQKEKSFDYIRQAKIDEWNIVVSFVWNTFKHCNARYYSEQGINSFVNYLADRTLENMFTHGQYSVFFAIKDNVIVGLIGIKNFSHVALLFVDYRYQKNGIGNRLVFEVIARVQQLQHQGGIINVTVNAAPRAEVFYSNIGFRRMGEPKVVNGMPTVPMKLNLEKIRE